MIIIAVLVLCAAGSTAGLMALYARRQSRRRKTGSRPRAKSTMIPTPASELSAGVGRAGEHRDEEVSEPEEPEETMMLARQFDRGPAGARLAHRLSSGLARRSTMEAVLRLASPGLPALQRAKTAKKLGVGKGEIDLAANLKVYEAHHRRKGDGR